MRMRTGYVRGETHPAAVLTEDDVRAIRAARNRSQSELAAEYGVTQSCVSLVRRRVTWKHV
jgi:DNA-binding transcriptional regulator YiaG